MAKNVTLKMDEKVLRAAQHMAVDEGLSLSAWLSKQVMIFTSTANSPAFLAARKSALQHLRAGLHLGGKTFTRDSLHVR